MLVLSAPSGGGKTTIAKLCRPGTTWDTRLRHHRAKRRPSAMEWLPFLSRKSSRGLKEVSSSSRTYAASCTAPRARSSGFLHQGRNAGLSEIEGLGRSAKLSHALLSSPAPRQTLLRG